MSSPPTTLGKYQIIREIARSNDIVYEAYDPLMNRRVALKELAVPSGSTQQQKEERLKRFLREAKAAGSLAHPNIVTIYEVGEDGGRNYLVMEYLDGHTLRNELDAKGFLPQDKAIEVAESVLRALEYAHSNGVIHRDIKPENIQLLADGRIKLTDFGIARLTFEPNLTMDGQVFGTPSYMSPEQVVGKDIDLRSDLFSVGVVLYEMLAGQKPFTGDSVVTITYAIMNKNPDQPQQISPGLWQVISKAIDKSSALRYASAADMLSALAVAKAPAPPPAQSVPTSMPLPMGIPPPLAQPDPYAHLRAPQGNPYAPQQIPYPGGSYGAPPPPAVPQAPIQYPYNPYGAQPQLPPGAFTPQAMPPPQPGLVPYVPQAGPNLPNTPLPPYYPPAPKKPLLTHTQRILAGKVILTILTIGTLFSAVMILLLYTSGEFHPASNSAPQPQISADNPPNPATNPPAETVADTGNAERLANEGQNLLAQGEVEDVSLAQDDLRNAIFDFENAAAAYGDARASKRQENLNFAAQARLDLAKIVAPSDTARARTILYEARKEVEPGSALAADINDELNSLL